MTMISTKRPLVLIVDDQPESIGAISRHLRLAGCDVEAVRTGGETMNFLASRAPDIIFLDLVLEQESGLDLCGKIRANPALADIPVLFFSGFDAGEQRVSGLHLGARDFISKSSDIREIVARIELHLKLAENERLLKQKNLDLSEAYENLRSTQEMVIQTEKLAMLGQLSAGVAHEMSTPMSFVISNLRELTTGIGDLYRVLDAEEALIERCVELLPDRSLQKEVEGLKALRKELQVGVMRAELNSMCRDSLEGVELLARIAGDLREFSRDDRHDLLPSDINSLIDKAVSLARVAPEGRIEVVRQYADLPPVMCIPGRITQVFLILIVNALQAMPGKGILRLSTSREGDTVRVTVTDTGTGISPEHVGRIFEPFFTTKPADKGTGLGLTIAQKIVSFHGGTISAASPGGQGAIMTVEIPLRQPEPRQ